MMKQNRFFYIFVIPSILIMMLSGTVYGGTVTEQREDALQNGQGSTVVKNEANKVGDTKQLILSPQRLKYRNDSDMESDTGSQSARRDQYKSYIEGEGEKKIKEESVPTSQ